MCLYIVLCDDVCYVYDNRRWAYERFKLVLECSWHLCRKYSCVIGEYLDDSEHTLDECLQTESAIIDHHVYKIIKVPSKFVDIGD